jgi:hypothetical protein
LATAFNRWGNGSQTRSTAPLNADAGTSGWTYPENNPCAVLGSGWRVPSAFEQWDMYRGNGSTVLPTSISAPFYNPTTAQTGSGNIWNWRPVSDNNVVGGAIISLPDTGEKVFLPAAGFRDRNGDISRQGEFVLQWSSTTQTDGSPNTSARNWSFTATQVGIGVVNNRASAFNVRCVKD